MGAASGVGDDRDYRPQGRRRSNRRPQLDAFEAQAAVRETWRDEVRTNGIDGRRAAAPGRRQGLPGRRAPARQLRASPRHGGRQGQGVLEEAGGQGVARYGPAEEVRRPRPHRGRPVRRGGGTAAPRRPGRLSLGGRPPDRIDHQPVRHRGAAGAFPAADLPWRARFLDRHERAGQRQRPGVGVDQGHQGRRGLAAQRHQGLDQRRPRERLVRGVVPHRTAGGRQQAPGPQPDCWST